MHYCDICPVPCARCFNASTCSACITGYYLTETNLCYLLPTYYLPVLNSPNAETCISKSSICQNCFIDGTYCLLCTPNSYANYSVYVSLSVSSLYGVHPYNGIAVDCKLCDAKFANCLSCNQSKCLTCKPGFYLQDFNNCTDTPLPSVVYDFKPCTDSLRC
jgi:hypothetical protein